MTHDTSSFKKVAALMGMMMLFGGAEISSADTIFQSKSFGPLSGLSDTTTLTYDLFNPLDGELSSVGLSLTYQIVEPDALFWTIEFELTPNNLVLNVSDSGAGNTSVSTTFGPVSGSFLAPFNGVGDFPVLFTYGAHCGFVGGPTCGTGWSGNLGITYTFTPSSTPAAVPLSGSLPLFATGLGALGLLAWRRKRKAVAA